MKKENIKMSNAVFIITNEKSCPYYELGEELTVESGTLSISSLKPACLHLAEEVKTVVTSPDNVSRFSSPGSQHLGINTQQSHFDCGGCSGLIQYMFKQDKAYSTLQMKLLMESEEVRKRQHLARYYDLVRPLKIFNSLENDDLKSLINFLEFKTVLPQKVLLEKDSPGTHLYIIISGETDVVEDSGQRSSKMRSGEIFGEVSLLSGAPHSNSIHTVTVTQVALLSIKNFRQILKKHPSLQIFLFKLLINRVQEMALRSGNISSGMSGNLEEIAAVDLMQLINSSQKTGYIEILSAEGIAQVYFSEGEIVHAHHNQLEGK
ncbi:MAG: cyclic nucleotide-binding domain-containing protein, partial [Desulfobulbia bacterium]